MKKKATRRPLTSEQLQAKYDELIVRISDLEGLDLESRVDDLDVKVTLLNACIKEVQVIVKKLLKRK